MLTLFLACAASTGADTHGRDTSDHAQDDLLASPPLASTDVVIIGGGASGLAAGRTALDAGAAVIIIEREPALGGSALYAGSYFAVGTPWQAKAGYTDSVELALQEWATLTNGGDPSHPWVENFLQDSADNLEWMTTFGGDFACSNEIMGPSSVPRTHNLQPIGPHPFSTLIEQLHASAWTETTAKSLLIEAGAVVGVVVEDAEGTQGWIAAQATVVATGGFARSDRWVYEALPALKGLPRHVGAWHNADGNGLDIIEAAGGRLENMDNIAIYGHSTTDALLGAPETQLVLGIEEGVVVDQTGQRVMNEEGLRGVWGGREALQHGQLYALYDETIWSRLKISGYGYNYMPVSDGSMSSAEFAKQSETPQAMTFQELGAEIGIDGAVLLQTVADFNTMVDRGDDDAFGRDMGTADALRDAPFYALPIATATGKSFGGAALATDGAVLDRDSQPIEGLFAAGEVAGILGGEHIGMGISGSIAAIVYTGRVAGESAARYAGH